VVRCTVSPRNYFVLMAGTPTGGQTTQDMEYLVLGTVLYDIFVPATTK